MPGANPAAAAAAAARDLIAALVNPATPSPLPPLADSHRQALYQLADIFSSITHPHQPTEPTEPAARPTIVKPIAPKLKVTFQLPTDPHPTVNKLPQLRRKDTPWPRPADTVAPPRVNTVPSPNVPVFSPDATASPPRVVAVPATSKEHVPLPRVAIVPTTTTPIPPPRVGPSKSKSKSQSKSKSKSFSNDLSTKAPTARSPQKQKRVRVPIATKIAPTTTTHLSPATYSSMTGNMQKARRARKQQKA
eukprot:scaffold14175_cov40-Attheya_sp.AAC.2